MRLVLISLLFLHLGLPVLAQDKYTLSGYVKDKETGEEQIGATVYLEELQEGVATNLYGFYSLTVPKGTYTLKVSYIGYKTYSRKIKLDQNHKLNILLEAEGTEIGEVVVTAEADNKNVESLEMSTTKIEMNTIRRVPALMGEVDVIKVIQLLPGVQTVGEGGSGFYVRGGGVDQNLVLLDEATVYNASHLMGFFSVFNSDIVKDVKLYKGGIPANYGGRLSSVLDIRMKEGNDKEYHATGGIGTVSSRLTVEGPIAKNKASFIASGRRTYGDLFLGLSRNENLKKSRLFFYDFNTKVNWRPNENNRIFASGYFGRDVLDIADLFNLNWGNETVTCRWVHIFNDKLFFNLTGLYSNFDYSLDGSFNDQKVLWQSGIKDFSVKGDFDYYLNPSNKIRFGFQTIRHAFRPGEVNVSISSDSSFQSTLQTAKGLEHAVFASNEQKITPRFSAIYGLRYSVFQNFGQYVQYNYDESYELADSVIYGRGDIFNTYHGLEPRLGLKYMLSDTRSVKASYNRTRQYLHLASNSTTSSPLDIWIPSSPNIKPQIADQVALGYFQNFKNNMYEGSVEVFYKAMNNAIDFKDHAVLILNPYLEGELRIGKARAYGLEFLTRKQKGRLTGWLSYTLSRAEKEISGINNGNIYPTKYDKRHDVSVVASYAFNPELEVGGTFVYSTGAAVTAPVGKYKFEDRFIPIYSTRNGARMPPYHRMDIAATYRPKSKKERRFSGEWVFSVYNVYARKNPYTISFRESQDNPGEMKAEMLYLFSIIPSLTYNFNF